MNLLVRCIIDAYSRTLDLYPRRFKDEFAEEMQIVFMDSAHEAFREGILPLAILCLKEFGGLPFNVLREFWHEVQGEDAKMQVSQFPPLKPGSWGDSFWAGLPHLLIAFLFATTTNALANTGLATVSGMVLGFLLLAGLLATILFTWRDHWPAWSASWYGYVALLIFLFSGTPYQYWSGVSDLIFRRIHFILLLLGLAALLYWLTRRNPIEGLLMALPLIIMFWVPVMEFIPNLIRFWLTFWLFLLPALTAMTITRLNDIKKAVWLVLGASVLTGAPIAYARTYWHNIPAGHFAPPTINQMIELFAVPWLASGALVLGPILGWGLWNLGRNHRKVGRISAVLVVAGMMVNLFGHFSHWWSFTREDYLNALQISAVYQPNETSSVVMVYAGLAAMLVGGIGLAVLTWKQSKLFTIALILVPLALPLVARFATYFGNYVNLAGTSFELVRLSAVSKTLIFLTGAVWLTMSGWTVTRLYSPSLREGIA